MHVALVERRAGNLHEHRVVAEVLQVVRAGIAHRGPQPARQLVQHVARGALVGHLALDALGHQLQAVPHVLLEVAVGRAARHGAHRAHAAIRLIGAALVEVDLARAFVGAGEQRAHHHAGSTACQCLSHIA